ncbi:MAG: antirestriction protein ArdA [Alphaproteobacteria bacterium]
MTQLHAQPYDTSAKGFYFSKPSEYAMRAISNLNSSGGTIEEYEIQFIDGEDIDCALAKAWELNQANFTAYLEAVEEWEESHKIRYIIAVGECGYSHEQVADDPGQIDMTLYELSSMKELAEHFVDEGLYGEIPKPLEHYIDTEAIARDLSHDYSEVTIAGTDFIFHCA